jgi:NitT/TauT family transport system substrate-binding protein
MTLRLLARIVLVAAALGAGAAAADDTLKLAIGQRGNWENSPPELGQKAGIFKKHGLDLEILYTQGAGETLQAVLSGSVDIGVGVGTGGTMGAFAKGAPVRAIANSTTGADDLFWYVPASSPVKSLKDAAGKTIAYSTTGSSTNLAVLAFIKHFDVQMSDVPSFRNQTVRVMIATAQTTAQKKDALARFFAAYRETLDWMYSDPAALKSYAQWVNVPEALAKEVRDRFYPKENLRLDRLSGIDEAMADAVSAKFMPAPLTKAQVDQLFADYVKAK